MCWQMDGHVYGPSAGRQTEQCLALDVYATLPPPPRDRLKPVVVFLYGGSLIAGSTASYPGLGKLAQLEDIVLVVPDYRIAAFGFLAHPCLELDDPRGVSGNYGLLDQQLALRWVQDNVAHFGGDPARVTVLGQSSGGTSILGLLASPHSAGLFHSAVSLSASPNVTMGLRQAYAQFDTAIRTTTQCGQGTAGASLREMAACLRALPAAEVAAMLPTAKFDVSPNLPASTRGQGYPGLIIVDGVTVVAEPEVALARGLVDVPLVLQTELAEMDTYENNATVNAMKNQAYADFFAGALTKGGWLRPAIAGLLDVYAEERNTSTELAYQMFIADYSFYCGSVELAMRAARGFKSPVYLSVGMHSPCNPLHVIPDHPPALFPGHNWDLVSAIESWDFYQIHMGVAPYQPCDSDVRWGASMRQQWVNLTRDGHIGGGFVPLQRRDTDSDYSVGLQTANGVEMRPNFGRDRCRQLLDAGFNKSFWLTN